MADGYNLGQAATLSPEDYAQQQALNRQQQMAAMLMQQGMQQPQGQMVSGHYVPTSFFQNLVPLANIAASQYIGNKADTQAAALAQKIREAKGTKEEKITNLITGTPEVKTELAGPYAGNVPMPVATKEAIKPDLAAALREINTNNPYGAGSEYKAALVGNMIPKKTDQQINYETYKSETPTGKALSFTDWVDRNEKQRFEIDKQRLGLEAARFNLEKSKAEVNPAEAGLRTSFLGQIQPHVQISQAYRKIESAPETAAGDMSRIFGFMKILDPGSTVREGEYASAENARGVPQSVMAQYNKVLSGQRLTPQQRQEFTQSAGDLVSSQKQQFETQKKYYTDISSQYKINPSNIIYDPYADLNIRTTPPKMPKQTGNVNQQLGIPQTNTTGGWNIIGVTPSK